MFHSFNPQPHGHASRHFLNMIQRVSQLRDAYRGIGRNQSSTELSATIESRITAQGHKNANAMRARKARLGVCVGVSTGARSADGRGKGKEVGECALLLQVGSATGVHAPFAV